MLRKTYLLKPLVGIFAVTLLYFSTFFVPRDVQLPVEINIREGMSFGQVVAVLKEKGILKDAFIFKVMAILTNADRRIKRGYYYFSGALSPYEILKRLIEGKVMEIRVTIPEGFNLWQIAERLQARGVARKDVFLQLAFDRELINALNIKAPSVEGYLFPDTYKFPKGIDTREVIIAMVNNMRNHFDDEMRHEAMKKGLTELEVLTLASIIEKEARVDEERPLISAVYHNRLKRGMPLQADPTTIYDLQGERNIVTKRDLQRMSPYNTYLYKGLPPGPIASPGLASIRAAIYPADVPYLYFVYNGKGRHIFSTTKEQHIKAVMEYRKGSLK